MKDRFHSYHPVIHLIYYILVLTVSMTVNHPAAQVILLTCAYWYVLECVGFDGVRKTLKYLLPMMLLTAVINPAFQHGGVTILGYFPTGNPLTLESILYGISAGCMLGITVLWFVSFHHIMTTDKLIYLFGRGLPALGLLLSMTLRFVPRFLAQQKQVVEAQASLGRDFHSGSLRQRLALGVQVLSIMITWSLENGMETAVSMRSRGYGTGRRTSFALYHMENRDWNMLIWLGICGLYLAFGYGISAFRFWYFPMVSREALNLPRAVAFGVLLLLGLTPVFINRREERLWNATISKM